ncbi:MAG: peptidoglycan DD-metalloendopeptidase family protein [Clostridia bacterium]|nr:peptidoglycan DD-metalloendopeptidase family protein [Clostridia bacterium]
MSKRRKHTNGRAKKYTPKKKEKVSVFDKIRSVISIEKLKLAFKEKTEKFEIDLTIDKILKHIKKNRNAYMFFSAMALVVTIGYFTIVYESDADKEQRLADKIIDVSLNESLSDVEPQLDDIQMDKPSEEVVVTLKDLNPEEITSGQNVEKIQAIADPVERISAASLTVNPSVDGFETQEAYKSVTDSMILGIDAYAIFVDDNPIAYFQTEGEAYMVLKHLEEKYKQADAVGEKIIFQENIEVKESKIDVLSFNGFMTKDEALDYIVKGTNESRFHTVEKGENYWVIAPKYGLTADDLESANPDVEAKRLQIGQQISLVVPKPLINVVSICTFERNDPIPYGRDANVETDQYYVNEFRVKRAGENGEALNVIEQYSINGRVIGEKTLSTEVLKDPVNQIMWAGTKPAPPRQGTGSFQNPTSRGYITSYFGSRSLGYHYGIDIGVPMHTDVYAADGGTVIFAGYKGTYGKLIMIDHGENKVSYYAHNDVLKVQKGDKVFKGQLIALSGNTGRSTGPHLHFEVRINGVAVNPIKYVNY